VIETTSILEALGATMPLVFGAESGSKFKAGMRRLAGGVTIVTTRGNDGELFGMTATAVCSLSTDPPTLLVCANRGGSFASHLAVGSLFSVNIVGSMQEDVARECAGMAGKRGNERFQGSNWQFDNAGPPFLINALARFDCVATSLIPASTHLLIIGHVTLVHLPTTSDDSLVYCEGNFVSIARPVDGSK